MRAPREPGPVVDRGPAGAAGRMGPARGVALACAAFAAAARAVYLLESAGNPLRSRIGLDMAGYDRWARAILEGNGLGEAPFTQAPFFPLILAATYRLLGADPVRALWMHLLPAAGAAFLIADAAGRWRGTLAAWCAGLLAGLLKPSIFYTGTLLPPAWVVFLAALCLWTTARILFAARSGPRREGAAVSMRALGACGLAFGGLALAQPAAALSVAPSAGWLVREAGPGRRSGLSGTRRRPRALALFLGAAAALPLATALYNGLAGRAWAPFAVNGGINFYIGNGPEANGAYVRPPAMREDRDLLGIEAARRLSGAEARGASFGPVDADRYWRGLAFEQLAHSPLRFAGLLGRKLLLFFGEYEVPQVESLPFERRYSFLLRLPLPGMACLVGLSLLGALLLAREPATRWLLASIGAIALGVCVFFVTARFRAPALPFLCVLAAGGLSEAIRRLRAAPLRRTLRLPVIAAAAAFALSLSNLPGLDRRAGEGQYHYRLGVIREEERRADLAMEEYRRALELDPTLGKAEVNLGTLLARAGRLDEARPHLERGVALDPQSAIGWTNLGQLDQLQGRRDAAEERFRRALEVDPSSAGARRSLEALLRESGREDEAQRLRNGGALSPPSTPAPAPRPGPSGAP